MDIGVCIGIMCWLKLFEAQLGVSRNRSIGASVPLLGYTYRP